MCEANVVIPRRGETEDGMEIRAVGHKKFRVHFSNGFEKICSGKGLLDWVLGELEYGQGVTWRDENERIIGEWWRGEETGITGGWRR